MMIHILTLKRCFIMLNLHNFIVNYIYLINFILQFRIILKFIYIFNP